MSADSKKKVKVDRSRSFLNKDFNSFRSDLLDYARTYFPDKIQDFSEASVGGLLLDLAAYVGDVSSFYLDHQFKELDPLTAVEDQNIERMLRSAGVKITGAAAAVANVTFTIEVPAERKGTLYQPKSAALPTIKERTTVSSGDVVFNLTEDLDFSEKDSAGNLIADVKVLTTDSNGIPTFYTVSRTGICASGSESEQDFPIDDTHVPFRTLSLGDDNVNVILSVTDTDGNEYYEVDALSQDTVFVSTTNLSYDRLLVNQNLQLRSAPRRFVTETDFQTKITTLRFGSGDSTTTDSDAIPDPATLSLPLYGKKSLSRFTIDPNSLLKSSTLGVSPRNTTITVRYRHGGGIDHNVGANTITSVSSLITNFQEGVPASEAASVRASIEAFNEDPASGGADAPTLDDLRSKIITARNAQSRIVTKQDLLSRIYTLPAEFGRVFRAGIRPNPNNPNASQLFIISRDSNDILTVSPDALKKNLVSYINEFRLISDAIDILDAQVINLSVEFKVTVDPKFSQETVLDEIIGKIEDYMSIDNFQIDQPVVISDLNNLAYNTPGVLSVVDIALFNKSGIEQDRKYSSTTFDVRDGTLKGMVFPPPGGIFEVKFPDFDIIGSAV